MSEPRTQISTQTPNQFPDLHNLLPNLASSAVEDRGHGCQFLCESVLDLQVLLLLYYSRDLSSLLLSSLEYPTVALCLGPCGGPRGGGRFLMSEVTLEALSSSLLLSGLELSDTEVYVP